MSNGTPTPAGTPESAVEAPWECVTCGQTAANGYCSHCGEKRPESHDFSMRHILGEAAEAFFHFDSKVLVSLKTLLSRPGRLTAEFFAGRRKPYMTPLQVFIVCNLIFFILQPLTDLEILAPPMRIFENNSSMGGIALPLLNQKMAKKHVARDDPGQYEEFGRLFYRTAHVQAKSLILMMVPMLAAVMALAHVRARRFFSEHLVFALHAYAWWLLWLLGILMVMAVLLLLLRVAGHPMWNAWLDDVVTVLEFGGFGVYLFFAQRTFYRDTLLPALIKSLALAFCVYYIFLLYRLMLFFTVLYTL
jgi:hypothetical protein